MVDRQELGYQPTGNRVVVSIAMEDMLRFVLGRGYDHCHSRSFSRAEWKRVVAKLVSKLEIAISKNVETDGIHRLSIRYQLERAKDALKARPTAEPQLSVALICLCFELMGDLPDNRKVNKTQETNFELHRHRSVYYLQQPRQKAKLILHTANWEQFKKRYKASDIESKWYCDYDQDPQKFLDWYKATYPDVYAELF